MARKKSHQNVPDFLSEKEVQTDENDPYKNIILRNIPKIYRICGSLTCDANIIKYLQTKRRVALLIA